ncbi:hypothetical protein GCM10009599_14610 [Luteococcus peritonei]
MARGFDAGLVTAHRLRDLHSLTVADAVAVYVASKSHLSARGLENVKVHAGHVTDALGAAMMHEVTRARVQEWVSDLTCSPSSAGKRLTLLRATFRLMGMPDPSVGVAVRAPAPLHEPLSLQDVAAIARTSRTPTPSKHGPKQERANADTYHALILVMGVLGLRVSEAAALRCRHVEKNTLLVPGTKTSTSRRRLTVPASVMARLHGLVGERGPDELLFQTSTGTAFTREKIGVIVRDASERAIGRRISPHQLRHAAAAAMLERTHGNLPVVSRALGHASTAVTAAVYGAVTDAAVGSALAKVALDFDAILDPDSASRFAAAQEHVSLVPDEDF